MAFQDKVGAWDQISADLTKTPTPAAFPCPVCSRETSATDAPHRRTCSSRVCGKTSVFSLSCEEMDALVQERDSLRIAAAAAEGKIEALQQKHDQLSVALLQAQRALAAERQERDAERVARAMAVS